MRLLKERVDRGGAEKEALGYASVYRLGTGAGASKEDWEEQAARSLFCVFQGERGQPLQALLKAKVTA